MLLAPGGGCRVGAIFTFVYYWIVAPVTAGVGTAYVLQFLATPLDYQTGLTSCDALAIGSIAAPVANGFSALLQRLGSG